MADELGDSTVGAVLDELFQAMGHLPRPHGLVQLIVDAHNRPTDGQPAALAGVIAALWPIGATAGAQRGHTVTLAGLLDALARIDISALPDARSRWIVRGFRHAAYDMPAAADPHRTYQAPLGDDLTVVVSAVKPAVEFGLANSWRAGHFKATTALLEAYGDAVDDLIGQDRLTTTFLTAQLTAHALLHEVDLLAYRFADCDREDPAGRPDPAVVMANAIERLGLAATRAFPPWRREPGRRQRDRAKGLDRPRHRRPGR
jgi:hypothetical protein